jgi:FKBP-type peptidyl-prolyl cis-trans isomerase
MHINKTSLSLAAVGALGISLLLSGCSSSSTTEAITSSAPATDAASAPYATTDCASAQPPVPAQSAPMEGQEIGGVVVQLDPAGVPTVTVSATAAAATELGSLDLVTGEGAPVELGANVEVNYCGIGLSSRTMFDSSWARGAPASFPLNPGGLIQGWIDGLPGMKVGGERLLLIPGSLGYGATPPQGSGIEPDETLIFIVQVTAVS